MEQPIQNSQPCVCFISRLKVYEYLNTAATLKTCKKEHMVKKCIYCKNDVPEESVIDFCERCGIGVWGEKMFRAIVQSMEKSRDAGDLFQGSVSNPTVTRTKV